jgi:hypothetical protein
MRLAGARASWATAATGRRKEISVKASVVSRMEPLVICQKIGTLGKGKEKAAARPPLHA